MKNRKPIPRSKAYAKMRRNYRNRPNSNPTYTNFGVTISMPRRMWVVMSTYFGCAYACSLGFPKRATAIKWMRRFTPNDGHFRVVLG